jgi:hypothetical protein
MGNKWSAGEERYASTRWWSEVCPPATLSIFLAFEPTVGHGAGNSPMSSLALVSVVCVFLHRNGELGCSSM